MIDKIAVISAAGICLIISLILLSGKGSMLIAGFNMLSKEKRDLIDEVALSKFLGKIMLLVTIGLTLCFASMFFDIKWLLIVLVVLTISPVIFAIVYTWKYKKFLKKEKKHID